MIINFSLQYFDIVWQFAGFIVNKSRFSFFFFPRFSQFPALVPVISSYLLGYQVDTENPLTRQWRRECYKRGGKRKRFCVSGPNIISCKFSVFSPLTQVSNWRLQLGLLNQIKPQEDCVSVWNLCFKRSIWIFKIINSFISAKVRVILYTVI